MRAASASWILDSAPAQTSGPVAVGSIAGVDREIGGGVVCVPSGAARGLWRVQSGAWTAVAVGSSAPLQVTVMSGTRNGLWVLPASHSDSSAYGSSVGA